MSTRVNTSTRVVSEHEHKSGDLTKAQELRVSMSTREESEHKHKSGE